MDRTEVSVWYAMRVTYRRELEVKRLLEMKAMECFIPMRYQLCLEKKKKMRKLVPAIHNLIFVHAAPSVIKQVKRGIPHLQYMTRKEGKTNLPIIVPNEEMQKFIAVSETYDDRLHYLRPEDINLKKGVKVRLHGGPFDGQEGLFVKVQGIRNKRVVVMIQGIVAVVMATVQTDLVEVIQ